MKDIYGNEVKNLKNANIVSTKEAEILYNKQLKEDQVRIRHGLKPIINLKSINNER